MTTEILINSRSYEVRIALVESGYLTEFHLQRPTEKGLMGNLYLGRVVRVLPGMQAAFVDIGLERTGFLYVDDALAGHELSRKDHPGDDQLNLSLQLPKCPSLESPIHSISRICSVKARRFSYRSARILSAQKVPG